jgi:dCMP deaminase
MLCEIAQVVAKRSTCCRLHVGAVIARDGRTLSPGYNGPPSGMAHCTPETCNADHPCTRAVHAEANAIAFAARHGISIDGAELFVTASPCNECAKLIINSGIKRVVYLDRYRDARPLELLEAAGIETEWFQ